jgi:mannosyltransferase OCH1-like enzyme
MGFIIYIVAIILYSRITNPFKVPAYSYVMPKDYDLPKQIWCYWDSGSLPEHIEEYYQNNKRVLDDWKITFLTDETLPNYIDVSAIPDKYTILMAQHKADYIRLAVLHKWGGTWMDASIIVNSKEAMEKLYIETNERKAQATLFTLGEPRADPSYI